MVIDGQSYLLEPWTAERQQMFRRELLDHLLNQAAWSLEGTRILAKLVCPGVAGKITRRNFEAINKALIAGLKEPTAEEIIAANAPLKAAIRANAIGAQNP